MHFPKGYKGPGCEKEDREIKKGMLKNLKQTMDKSAASKAAAAKQKKEQKDSKFVSSVEPTYPGFKGEK